MKRIWAVAAVLPLVAVACGEVDVEPGCLPGTERVCQATCPGGTSARSVCRSDQRFGPCECPADAGVDGPTGDVASDSAAVDVVSEAGDAVDDARDASDARDGSDAQSGICQIDERRCADGQPQGCGTEQDTWVDLDECESDEVCLLGECEPLPEGYGDDCDGEGCPSDLVCHDGICLTHERSEVGGDCLDDRECQALAWCNGLGRCTEGEEASDCMADSDCGEEAPVCGLDRRCTPNTPPTIETNTGLTVDEGEASGITPDELLVTDLEHDPGRIKITVEAGPDHGSLRRDGVELSAGDTFTQRDIDNDLVSYAHDGSETTADGFTFRVADAAGAQVDGSTGFVITVTPVNDAPSDIGLSHNAVVENAPAGTAVGQLSTTDADDASGHIYNLVSGEGDSGNASFQIDGAELQTAVVLDHEAADTLSVRVLTDDGHGGTYAEVFGIMVEDVNDAPTDIALSSQTVAENLTSGAVVGTFSTTDQDADETHTFTLTSGDGDDDNDQFDVEGANLVTTATFDHEAEDAYSVRVRVTDQAAAFIEEAFTISVGDVNEQPTFASSPILDATVGEEWQYSVTTADPDAGEMLTISAPTKPDWLSLVAGVVGTASLEGTPVLADEGANSVTLRVEDTGGLFDEQAFVITVDVNDPPSVDVNDGFHAPEGGEHVISNTELQVVDPDDDPDEITLTVTTLPEHGTLKLTGTDLEQFDSFTQDDIDWGRVSYVHDDTETESDGFVFDASDGRLSLTGQPVSITIDPVGDEGSPCDDPTEDCLPEVPICSSAGICQDGDSGDPCAVSSDCGATAPTCGLDGSCRTCDANASFESSRPVVLYEPCAPFSTAYAGDCVSEDVAHASGASSWVRTDEAVEIPLRNGFIDASVAGYWRLDGGSTSDASLWGNYGVGSTTPTTLEGAFGDAYGAVNFAGGNYSIQVDDSEGSLAFTDAVTVMAWISRDLTEGYGTIVSKLNEGGYRLRLTDTFAEFTIEVSATLYDVSLEEVLIPSGEWTHLAGTYDGEVLALYVNGELAHIRTGLVSGPLDSHSDNALCLGAGLDGGGACANDYFDGGIDDVVVLDRALTPTEIAAYYRSGQPFGTSLVPGAQGDFDDVRVSEEPAGEPAERVVHEVVGVRPHSDTDLDGVEAYWRFEGDMTDLTGAHDAADTWVSYDTGRFGLLPGNQWAMGDYATMKSLGGIPSTVLTVEAWVRLDSVVDQTIIEYRQLDGWSLGVESGQAQFRVTTYGDAETVLGGPVPTGRWVHLAGTCDGDTFRIYVDGVFQTEGTITRDSGPNMENMMMIGCTWDPTSDPSEPCFGDYFDGLLDELIIHDEVKSDDYIYNRAHPSFPMVRFLASTGEISEGEGEAYPYYGYRLHWDSAEAAAVRPWVPHPGAGDPCLGLLSPCNGYEGWWRLDELGDDVIDSSTWRRHGTADSGLEPKAGLDLLARDFASGDLAIRLPGAAADGLVDFTLETTSYFGLAEGALWWWSAANSSEADELTAKGEYSHPSWLWTIRVAGAGGGVSFDFPLLQWAHTSLTRQADGSSELTIGYSDAHSLAGMTGDALEVLDEGLVLGADVDCPSGVCSLTSYGGNTVDSFRVMNRVLTADEMLHFPPSAWMLDDPVSSTMCIPAPLGAGEGCSDDVECESADCDAGFCAAP